MCLWTSAQVYGIRILNTGTSPFRVRFPAKSYDFHIFPTDFRRFRSLIRSPSVGFALLPWPSVRIPNCEEKFIENLDFQNSFLKLGFGFFLKFVDKIKIHHHGYESNDGISRSSGLKYYYISLFSEQKHRKGGTLNQIWAKCKVTKQTSCLKNVLSRFCFCERYNWEFVFNVELKRTLFFWLLGIVSYEVLERCCFQESEMGIWHQYHIQVYSTSVNPYVITFSDGKLSFDHQW